MSKTGAAVDFFNHSTLVNLPTTVGTPHSKENFMLIHASFSSVPILRLFVERSSYSFAYRF
jgi:hypothetical protein